MPLLCEKRGHVAILTLSRPEARNAWDEDFNEGLEARLSELEHDHEIRCVILTGDERGGAFSAGANLADTETHTVASPADFVTGIPHWRKFAANLLTDFPKPVIAAVNGYAIGIGCIATYCCDLIVASERAEWRLPQVRLGIMPAYGGAVRLRGTEGCAVRDSLFKNLGGSGVMIKDYNLDALVAGNEFVFVGEHAICSMGRGDRQDQLDGDVPTRNAVVGNYAHEFGLYVKAKYQLQRPNPPPSRSAHGP